MPKQTKKVVKAWAVVAGKKILLVEHGRIDTLGIFPKKKEAMECFTVHCKSENYYKVVLATITYSLPTPKQR